MFRRQQPRDRVLDEVRIAQREIAIDIGMPHRLGEDVDRGGRSRPELLHRERLDDPPSISHIVVPPELGGGEVTRS